MTDLTDFQNGDQPFIRRATRPQFEGSSRPALRLADVFCGCGALTLGIAEAARQLGWFTDVRLAVDNDDEAVSVFRDNFPDARVVNHDVERLFDGELGRPPTGAEEVLASEVGSLEVLVAGPPCQGHSSLNNHTRLDDPRNKLYSRAIRAVEVLQPRVVVIENVPGVVRDKSAVMSAAVQHLIDQGWDTHVGTVRVERTGVPQRRRRHLLVAARDTKLETLLQSLESSEQDVRDVRDVRWAIGDLVPIHQDEGYDAPSQLSNDNRRRVEWLLRNDKFDLPNRLRPPCHKDNDHTYKSMYGRLAWDEPAQTITTGFGSPGQGRYIHPGLPRTLTPHEAARIQTIPDFFSFEATSSRGAWARMIGNAVPPVLAMRLAAALLPLAVAGATGQRMAA